jgi:predicted ATPase
MLHQVRQEPSLVQARAEAALTLATEQEFLELLARTTPLRGWALAAGGHAAEGGVQLQQGVAAYHATGMTGFRAYSLALLAEVCAEMEHTSEGLAALAEALATLTTSGHPRWEAGIYRLKGELLLQHAGAQPGEAEACVQQALEVARRQQAKSLELRAAMSLSRLWQRQGQPAAAYTVLAPVYSWFTEGFETADLQEAKALLEELA